MLAALAFAGCRPEAPAPTPLPAALTGAASERPPGTVTLAARIDAADDTAVTGAVVITEEDDRLIVATALDGLSPGGYLLHVYAGAECGAPGDEPSGESLGSFDADGAGQARFSVERAGAGGAAAFVDRAVAIHSRTGDGEPGVQAGCGVLRPIAR